jgi:hypothetical protein
MSDYPPKRGIELLEPDHQFRCPLLNQLLMTSYEKILTAIDYSHDFFFPENL